MQDLARGGLSWEPVKKHYAAQLRGVAYRLRLHVRDECMEATVEARTRGALPTMVCNRCMCLTVGVVSVRTMTICRRSPLLWFF